MKNLLTPIQKLCVLCLLLLSVFSSKGQYVTIPDTTFVSWLNTHGFGACMAGNQLDTTCPAVLNATTISCYAVPIHNLSGIQYFKNLDSLDCSNDSLYIIPVLPPVLQFLNCDHNKLDSLPVLPPRMSGIICTNNQLTVLPVLTDSLISLDCSENQILVMPALPPLLQTLICFENGLTSLPTLDTSLIDMDCSYNNLYVLPVLPFNLLDLSCELDSLDSLPALPASLEYLDLYGNNVTALPALPGNLIFLRCTQNLLTSLPGPMLPVYMQELDCDANMLDSLPVLPLTLYRLVCDNNNLTTLPALPAILRNVSCSHNQLNSLPVLPDSMNTLLCNDNSNLSCLPQIKRIVNLNFANTAVSCLPDYGVVTNSSPPLNTVPLCDVINAHNCPVYWDISGQVYYDANNDCNYDAGDAGQNYIKLQLYNNGTLVQQTYTGGTGNYSFQAPYGNYVVVADTTNVAFAPSCPQGGELADTISTTRPYSANNNFAFTCRTPGYDVGTASIATRLIARPATVFTLNTTAGDMSELYGAHCAAGISGQVIMNYSGPVTYLHPAAGALTPSITGNTLTWNIADYGTVNNFTDFNMVFEVDSDAVSGNAICFEVIVTPIAADYNPGNNKYDYCLNVIDALDPNEKEVYPNNVDSAGEWLTYTIHFQNTGNAPALNILVTDTLDSHLDPSTFQLLAYSAKNITQLYGNAVKFNFADINLVDSAASDSASRGYVQYRVKTSSSFSASEKISNTADIYFDLNAPVATNTVVDSVAAPAPICTTTYDTIARTICQGDTLSVGGYMHTTAGNFTDTLTNAGGCDSVVSLNLNIDEPLVSAISIAQDTFCNRGSAVAVSAQPTGGIFAGSGVSGGQFNPAAANSGQNTISYTITDSLGCKVTSITNVYVIDFPDTVSTGYVQQPNDPQTAVTTFFAQPYNGGNYAWQQLYAYDSSTSFLAAGDTFIVVCWNYGEGKIDTVMGDNYFLTVRAVVSFYGCTDTTEWITIPCQVWGGGINHMAENNAISLYPNPATDQLYIKAENMQPVSIALYDADGRMIFSRPFAPVVDVNTLSSGVYFVEIKSNEGIVRKRFVKM